jgi:pyridoxine/pyridoxamine 5'-phosphate oxidase
MEISSYDDIYNNYKEVLNSSNLGERPSYWGGFSFKPYYFEFWTGDENRINKREAFLKEAEIWRRSILQP